MNNSTIQVKTITYLYSLFSILVICLFFLNTTNAQEWSELNTPGNSNLNGIILIDDNTAIAVGNGGEIIHTTDGGKTWNTRTSLTTNNLNTVVLLANGNIVAAGNSGTISASTDNGVNWTSFPVSLENLHALYFLNNDTGFVAGSNGEIRKTINGGATVSLPLNTGTTETLYGLYFVNDTIGYATGSNGVIIKTTDAGDNWSTLSSPTNNTIYDIIFLNDTIAFAVCEGGTDTSSNPKPVIIKSTDAGDNWSNIQTSDTNVFYNIIFLDDTTAYIAGKYGIILKSTDAGNNWSQLNSSVTDDIFSIVFSNHNNGYAGGETGMVLKTCPLASFSINTGIEICQTTTVSFTNTSISAYDYKWEINNDSVTSTENLNFTFNDTGIYIVRLIAYIENCSDTSEITLTIIPSPKAEFSVNDQCYGDTILFTNNTVIDTGIISYLWYFGDGDSSFAEHPEYFYSSYGSYEVSLIAYSVSGGCTDSYTDTLHLFPSTQAGFSYKNTCFGDTVFFTNNSVTDTGAVNSIWYFGDGDSSLAENPYHIYSSRGTYEVMLVAYSGIECADTVKKTLEITSLPVADFTVDDQCYGDTIVFTNNSTIDTGSFNSLWYFGDGDSSFVENPEHFYNSYGNYNVQLFVYSSTDCYDSVLSTLELYPSTIADFSIENSCFGETVSFTNNSTADIGTINSLWYFGDGDSSTAENPDHIYSTHGIFEVMLIAYSDTNCIDTLTKIIEITSRPVAGFAVDDQCYGDTLVFTNTSTIDTGIVNYIWYFGDGDSSFAENPEHFYNEYGIYDVTLIAFTSMECTDTVFSTLELFATPVADFTVSNTCFDNFTQFTNNSTIADGSITYFWDLGDSTFSANEHESHIYDTIDSYNVKLIITSNNGCVDSVMKIIDIQPLPEADFEVTGNCQNSDIFFTNTTTLATNDSITYEWDFDDGSAVSNDVHPVHNFTQTGSFNVTLTATSIYGCVDMTIKTIEITSAPLVDFTYSTACLGDTVFFNNLTTSNIPLENILWEFGDGNTSTDENPYHIYATADSFEVKLTVSDTNSCEVYLIKPLILAPLPLADFNAANVCIGEVVTFINGSTYSGDFPIFEWHFGDGNTSFNPNPSHLYQNTGTYNVTLYVTDANGCIDEIEKSVEVVPEPIADFVFDDLLCNNFPIKFTNTSTLHSTTYTAFWDFGDGNTSTDFEPEHIYELAGNYEVKLVIESGCKDSIIKNIEILDGPEIDFTYEVYETQARFTPSDLSLQSYLWNFGDGKTSQNTIAIHTFPAKAAYNVSLTVTDDIGCSRKITKTAFIGITFIEGTDNNFNFEVYPIPFKDIINFELELNENSNVNISLWDVSGKNLGYFIENESFSTGTHQFSIPTANVLKHSGVYLMVLEINGVVLRYTVISQ